MRVGVDIRLLHDVLGLAVVPQDCARAPIEPFVVAPHQDLEQGRLAAHDASDDLFIR
jgi:hypothetical protein